MALMGRLFLFIEDLVLFVIFLQSTRASTFKGNYIGCLFSADVCSEYELCSDDGLFGVCKDSTMAALEVKTIRLSREQVSELEQNMQYLVDNGYTWHHEYTQCFVKHLVSEYIKGRNHVKNPVECARQESERKLENFGNMLQRKEHNFDNSETMRYASPYGNDYDWTEKRKLDSYADDKLEQEEGEEFRQYLNKLNKKEIDNLKQFLIMESLSASDNDSVVKKSPLSTITKVVVHYNPDGPINDNTNNPNVIGGAKSEKYPDYSTMLEQLIPSTNVVVGNYEPKYVETTQEISKGQSEERGPGKFRFPPATVSSSLRPNFKHFIAGNQLSKNSQFGGVGANGVIKEPIEQSRMSRNRQKYLVTMYVLCGFVVIATFLAVILYFVRRRSRFREKISRWANKDRQDSTGDYQDLCRHHMQSRLSEKLIDSPSTLLGRQNKAAVLPDTQSPPPLPRKEHPNTRTSSTNSSTSSWTEEPVNPNMDISTGHLILSYMEDHMKNKDRLQKEWEDICSNDGEPCSIVAGIEPMNMRKNRCTDILPYEHSRIKLNPLNNVSGSDYINANFITDHDPRNPAYIATQGPLPHTVADFWQMIWEQNSVVIVNLTRLWENSTSICHRYWPEEGTDLYHIYEVQLISEHLLCDDFVVRSLFLKNLQINETRTVTQFHFLTWPEHKVPSSTKVLLDFRRKVNKSYRGRSSPMVIHCSDGAGRTGSYCLIDMSLNRLSKGAKEIDIAATLEHLRDQRINMVRTKEQFEFALSAVAEEVHAILNFAQP